MCISAYRLEFLLPLAEYFSIRGSSPVLAGTRVSLRKEPELPLAHLVLPFSVASASSVLSVSDFDFLFLKTLCLCASVVNSCFLFGFGYAGLGRATAPSRGALWARLGIGFLALTAATYLTSSETRSSLPLAHLVLPFSVASVSSVLSVSDFDFPVLKNSVSLCLCGEFLFPVWFRLCRVRKGGRSLTGCPLGPARNRVLGPYGRNLFNILGNAIVTPTGPSGFAVLCGLCLLCALCF